MNPTSSKFRLGAIVWSFVLAVGVIVIGGSILLPSTKRAHFEFQPDRPDAAEDATVTGDATANAPAAATTQP